MKSTAILIALVAFMVSNGVVSAIGWTQSFAVQGKLICKGRPAEGTKLKIYDEGVIWDTKMDEDKANGDGEFRLSGYTSEITNIDPKLNIYHKCDWSAPCDRKFTIYLPTEYITQGETPTKVYDVGTINLENKSPDESKDCVN